MAYSITNLINEYNSNRSLKLANTAIKQNGFIAYGSFIPANKGLAHTYTLYSTLPTAGVRTLGDGVAVSDVSGSTTTVNMTPFQVTHQRDAAYVENFPGGISNYFTTITPMYLASLFQTMQKAYIYGSKATFGVTSYVGNSLISAVSGSANSAQLQTMTTASNWTGSTIFAVRFNPFEQGDGAAIAVDVSQGVYYTNPDWAQGKVIAGSTGPFPGYQMLFMGNNSLILPGSNNVAAITAIVEDTSEPTAGNINTLLDAVKADGNTFIFCNRVGKRILNDIGKNEYLQMTPNEFGYSDVIASWNGVPIILDQNLSTAETYTLWH